MAVVLAINPTVFNVCTDLFLLLMQLIWIRIMEELSRLNIKRSLRLGHRVFTYDRYGSAAGVADGWKRNKQLKQFKKKKSSGEDDEEKAIRSFRYQPFVVVTTMLLSAAIVCLHAVIDVGLDFAEEFSQRTSEYTSVEMIGLESNPSIVETMEQLRTFDFSKASCSAPTAKCAAEADRVHEYLSAKVLESFRFARNLFQSSSVTHLDVLQRLEIEYVGGEKREPGTPARASCAIEEREDMDDYFGNLTFADDECSLRAQWVRAVEIDMRAKKALSTSVSVDTSGFGKELNLGDRSTIDYFTYKRVKTDGTYEATKASLRRLEDSPEFEDPWKHVAELDVQASMEYRVGSKQNIKITDLTRSRFGRYDDKEWEHTLQTILISGGSRDNADSPCILPMNVPEGRGRYGFHMTIALDDVSCSYTGIMGVLNNCNIQKFPLGETNVTFGFQTVEGGILIDPEDECGKLARERYAPYYKEDEGSVEGLFLGIQTEIVCTGSTRLNCAYGADIDQKLFYGAEGFTLNRDEISGDFIRLRRIVTELSWLLLQISGGDPKDVTEVIHLVGKQIKEYLDVMRKYNDLAVTRRRLHGAVMHFTVQDILAGLSAQVLPIERDLLLREKVSVSVINGMYIAGLGAVVLLVLGGMTVVAFEYWVERRAYHALGLSVKIPMTISSWIEAALSGSRVGNANTNGMFRAEYEFVALPVDNNEAASNAPCGYFRSVRGVLRAEGSEEGIAGGLH